MRCKLGFHAWVVGVFPDVRYCNRCGQRQIFKCMSTDGWLCDRMNQNDVTPLQGWFKALGGPEETGGVGF